MKVETNPINLILNNVVDKDIQSVLFPLNLMQYLTFCPKCCIRNNTISPNNIFSTCISFVGTLSFIAFYVFCSYLTFNLQSFAFNVLSHYFDCIFYSFGFAMNFFVAFMHTNNFVKFVLILQRIHRCLNTGDCFKKFIKMNRIFIILFFNYYAISFFPGVIQLQLPLPILCICWLLIIFDFNIIYATQVMKLLVKEVVLWNINVMNPQESDYGSPRNNKFFKSFVDILECYELYKRCFQVYVSI